MDNEKMCHCPHLKTLMISTDEYHRHTDRIVEKFVDIVDKYTKLVEEHLELKHRYQMLKEKGHGEVR